MSGRALIEIDGESIVSEAGEYQYIPLGANHRLTNIGERVLELIEVQVGTYLGEDDIVRLDDLYGRES